MLGERSRFIMLVATVVCASTVVGVACLASRDTDGGGGAGLDGAPEAESIAALRHAPAPVPTVPAPAGTSKKVSSSPGYEKASAAACAAGGVSCGSGVCCPSGWLCDPSTESCRGRCTADYPDLCDTDLLGFGGSCCLRGGCPLARSKCQCPPDLPNRRDNGCYPPCPQGFPSPCGEKCCAGGCNAITQECGCGAGTTACGGGCCAAGEECFEGNCVACPAEHPIRCGATCCGPQDMCTESGCQRLVCPSDYPVSCRTYCCPSGFVCGDDAGCAPGRYP